MEIRQLHSSEYRNPTALPPGAVLVVGTAQSGAQIAEEPYQSGRNVYLCVSSAGRIPRRYRGKDTGWWMNKAGFFDVTFDFGLVRLPVLDGDGYPIQKRGITDCPGLYFVGLPWLHTPKSGLLFGVGDDAAAVAADINMVPGRGQPPAGGWPQR